jgi:hypothetical protein
VNSTQSNTAPRCFLKYVLTVFTLQTPFLSRIALIIAQAFGTFKDFEKTPSNILHPESFYWRRFFSTGAAGAILPLRCIED